jgi:Protein of unknown function (DUF732)
MLRVHRLLRPIGALTVFAGLITGSALVAAPAQADPSTDDFLSAVTSAGLGGTTDPANMVALGKSVCPMLSDPGQNAADVAAKVADSTGMSLGGANLFTGLAISFLCPRVVDSIGAGQSPIPTGLLGF